MLPIELHFLRPEWLWLWLPTVLMIALYARKRLRQSAWSDVIAPELLVHLMPQAEKPPAQRSGLWFALAWTLGVLGMAGPSWEQTPVPVSQQKAAYVIVMDLSYSMYAEDMSPSRLERTKQKVRDLLSLEQDTQIGLVAYAGEAHVVTPLTDDRGTIENLIPALNPSMMPVPGSDPLDALQQAKNLLQSSGIPAGGIIWFTDDTSPSQSQEIQTWLNTVSVELAIIGVGTAAGAPIPLANGGFLKDSSGSIVVPTLPIETLRTLAASAGGRFQIVSTTDADVAEALEHVTQSTELNQIEIERQADTWADAGYWLIIPWLLLLLVTIMRNPAGQIAALLIIVNLPLANSEAEAQNVVSDPAQTPATTQGTDAAQNARTLWQSLWQTPNQQAIEQLESDPKAAADLFEDPEWSAIARYQAQEHSQALEQFEQLEAKTASEYYNLGNARAKAGRLPEALEAYEQSLTLEKSEDAQFNYDLVKRLLEQQQQQENNQNDQQGDGSAESKDNQNTETPSSNGEESEDQDQQDSQSDQSDSQSSNAQQDQQDEQRQQQDQGQENDSESTEQPEQESQSGQMSDELDAEQQAMAQQAIERAREDQEKQQAMEQWIRRIEDDPSGLLREKFRYESERRQRERSGNNERKIW